MTLQLSWDRAGSGEPLLLLHGIGTTHADFAALRPGLDAAPAGRPPPAYPRGAPPARAGARGQDPGPEVHVSPLAPAPRGRHDHHGPRHDLAQRVDLRFVIRAVTVTVTGRKSQEKFRQSAQIFGSPTASGQPCRHGPAPEVGPSSNCGWGRPLMPDGRISWPDAGDQPRPVHGLGGPDSTR